MPNRLTALLALLLTQLLAASTLAQTPVNVARPGLSGSTETLRLTGNLTARRTASLSPQVAGRIHQLPVDAGDVVESGDLIAALDDRLASLQVDRAMALRDEASAALVEAQRLAEEGQRLTSSRFLPATEVRAREAAVAAAEAALKRAEADLAIERERAARHRLEAPFAGIISARLAQQGEWVEPGSAVVVLVEVEDLWLDVRVPQAYWADIVRDRIEVRARADAVPDRLLDTEIVARVPVSDPTARTFLLRLLVHDQTGDLTPGMSARVELDLTSDEPRTRIPRDALLRDPDGTIRVWLLADDSDRVREQVVSVRRVLGTEAELTDALPENVRVVVRGNEGLSDGETVRVVEALR